MKCAVTISLVPEARGGPFVFRDDLDGGIESASRLGFHAVELFFPSAREISVADLKRKLASHRLELAALGTGAGWLREKLTLTDGDSSVRKRGVEFIKGFIELGSEFGAPVIIGSMQGRWSEAVPKDTALGYLRDGLDELGRYAAGRGTRVLFEPINRYESNLVNRLEEGMELVQGLGGGNVRLLADLFHMNIEETSIAGAFATAGGHVGHVHFVDSNRWAAGMGHIDYGPIVKSLRAIGYGGYLSAEAFPRPDSETAARQTRMMFAKLIET